MLLLDKSTKIQRLQELTNISNIKKQNKLLKLDRDLDHIEDSLNNLILDPEDTKVILQKEKFPMFDMSLFQRSEISNLKNSQKNELDQSSFLNLKKDISSLEYVALEKGIKTKLNIRRKLKFFFLSKNSQNASLKNREHIEQKLVSNWGQNRFNMEKLIKWFCSTIRCIADGEYEDLIFKNGISDQNFDHIMHLANQADGLKFSDEKSQQAYDFISKEIQ
jgi:hypothetical protein